MLVVPGALAQLLFVREPLPGAACIIGAKNGAVLSLHDGPDAVLSCARDGHTDLAYHACWQSLRVGDIAPGIPAIGRLVETTALAAAVQGMRETSCTPESGVEN